VEEKLSGRSPGPPRGDNWVHEIKFDGYRLVAVLNQGDVKVFTRAANDWTHRFNPLCAALAKLKVANAVIDGEAVHVEENGSFSFHGLQNALSTGKLDRLQYYAFDLLHLDGIDLRDRPLTDRKARLEKILINPPPLLAYSEHFVQPGNQVFERACDLALEGIVSKRADAAEPQADTGIGASLSAVWSETWAASFKFRPKHSELPCKSGARHHC
jgi:bifunctional non-homologous end joining protein LigD